MTKSLRKIYGWTEDRTRLNTTWMVQPTDLAGQALKLCFQRTYVLTTLPVTGVIIGVQTKTFWPDLYILISSVALKIGPWSPKAIDYLPLSKRLVRIHQ